MACIIINALFVCLWTEGGRLQHELQYTEEALGVGSGSTYEIVIQTSPKGPSRNVLTVPSMLKHLKALEAAVKVNVHLFDV
jgi:patched 1 protein